MLWGQMHGPIYTLVLLSVVGSNSCSMVPFTPCTCVCFGVKSTVRFTPCTCDQIHGPIYTLYNVFVSVLRSNAWSHLHPCTFVCCVVKLMLHGSIYTLYLCLLWGQTHAPWFHLHLVLVSVLGSNPRSDLLPVLVIKSMVPFTPSLYV